MVMVWITHDNSKNEYQELASGYLHGTLHNIDELFIGFFLYSIKKHLKKK